MCIRDRSGAAAVTAAIAETSGAADDDLVPGIVARTLWWTHRSIFLVALRGLLAEEDREQLVARLRVAADRAYDQLAGGLVLGPGGGVPETGDVLLAVLPGQQAVQRAEEDRPVRPPQRAGDDAGHEIVVGRA